MVWNKTGISSKLNIIDKIQHYEKQTQTYAICILFYICSIGGLSASNQIQVQQYELSVCLGTKHSTSNAIVQNEQLDADIDQSYSYKKNRVSSIKRKQ